MELQFTNHISRPAFIEAYKLGVDLVLKKRSGSSRQWHIRGEWFLWLLACIFFAAGILLGLQRNVLGGLWTFLGFLLARRALKARHAVGELYDRNRLYSEPRAWELTQSGFRVSTKNSTSHYDWSEIPGWRCNDNVCAILASCDIFFYITRDGLEPQTLWLDIIQMLRIHAADKEI